jgi:hypothetical protein
MKIESLKEASAIEIHTVLPDVDRILPLNDRNPSRATISNVKTTCAEALVTYSDERKEKIVLAPTVVVSEETFNGLPEGITIPKRIAESAEIPGYSYYSLPADTINIASINVEDHGNPGDFSLNVHAGAQVILQQFPRINDYLAEKWGDPMAGIAFSTKTKQIILLF